MQTRVIRGEQITLLGLRDQVSKVLVEFGEQCRRSASGLVEPIQLPLSKGADPAEHEGTDTIRVRLSVEDPEARAPRAAKDHVPFRNLEAFPKRLDVLYEQLGGVFTELGTGSRFAGTALVEHDEPVDLWVEENRVFSVGACTRPAMEEDYCVTTTGSTMGPAYVLSRTGVRIVYE